MHQELKEMMEDLRVTPKFIASITGHTENSIRVMLAPGASVPRWIRFSIWIWKEMKRRNKTGIKEG